MTPARLACGTLRAELVPGRPNTVADHLKAVFAKTVARSRAELAAGLAPGSVRT